MILSCDPEVEKVINGKSISKGKSKPLPLPSTKQKGKIVVKKTIA